MSQHDAKRVVVWGTGFVGRMVLPEIVKHPLFDLVGVGVSNPDSILSVVVLPAPLTPRKPTSSPS